MRLLRPLEGSHLFNVAINQLSLTQQYQIDGGGGATSTTWSCKSLHARTISLNQLV